eukprot:8061792-Alexandrium_andersonii.AAC.1
MGRGTFMSEGVVRNNSDVRTSPPLHIVQLRDGNGYTRNSVVPLGDTIINAGDTERRGGCNAWLTPRRAQRQEAVYLQCSRIRNGSQADSETGTALGDSET